MDGLKLASTENLLSSDGIYPSVLGHAIIANEVLAATNATYQVQVPLISIKDYLITIGYK